MKGICGGLQLSVFLAALCFLPRATATPYASGVTNTAGTISFYLNEGGASVTVTYENGSTNAGFNGVTTGTNLPAGPYSFALGGHTSYSISVFKLGTGSPSLITNSPLISNLRGIDVNRNATSPYFGRVYFVHSSSAATSTSLLYALNSDFSLVTSNTAGVAWQTDAGNPSSPYRIAVAPDDYLMAADFTMAGSAIYRLDPGLTTNRLALGPVGVANGQNAGVHGSEESRPLVIGNLAAGSATMLEIDGDFPLTGSNYNSVLVYSNLTLSGLPVTNVPPSLVGPTVGISNISGESLLNTYAGLTRGPNGYLYASQFRDVAFGNPPSLQIYDSTITNEVWNSQYNSGNSDYFINAYPGRSTYGIVDSAVSPDGNYFVGLNDDGHMTVCSLTNGIPNVSTLFLIAPTKFTATSRGVCWDAADNLYCTSSGTAQAQEWALGLTATAVTTGNASGPTGFQMTFPATTIALTSTNSLISQTNSYGNPTNTTLTITRTGTTNTALTVDLSFGGTAPVGTYTATAAGSIVFAPGQTSTNIVITAVSDGVPRPTTSVIVALSPSPTYTLAPPATTEIDILNTAPNKLVVTGIDAPSMYNCFPYDYSSFIVTRWGDLNASFFTASNFNLAGTAVPGVDFTIPSPVTFYPGDLTQISYILPLINGHEPVHTNNQPYVGNKSVVVSTASGPGYTGATNSVALTIIDSANPAETAIFADALTSANDATNWLAAAASSDEPETPLDYSVTFGYDLANGDPLGPIPFPPNGAPTALRVTANKSAGVGSPSPATAVNLYPAANLNLTGNFAVRFNMNITAGTDALLATEGPLFGINHNGRETNWWVGNALSGSLTNWASDGIWYWISADAHSLTGDYLEFTGINGALPNNGWEVLGNAFPSSFINAFKGTVFSGFSGSGLPANGSPDDGYDVSAWSDVEIKQFNRVITLSIDKTPIFVYTNTTTFTNGTLMLGYEDPFDGTGGPDGAVYYSNLRVVRLDPPQLAEVAVNHVSGTFVFDFTTGDSDATASSFQVLSSSAAPGPYTVVSNASISQLGTGAFQAVAPTNGLTRYYRIQQL